MYYIQSSQDIQDYGAGKAVLRLDISSVAAGTWQFQLENPRTKGF
tara:strand:+ start:350 stop:484 length:135 start_codon:yes stop_codon:yes gene_type:complete